MPIAPDRTLLLIRPRKEISVDKLDLYEAWGKSWGRAKGDR